MKIYRFLLIATLCGSAVIAVMTGCKYDVAEPLWEKPIDVKVPSPSITGITPNDSAAAGKNTITLQGQNFNDSLTGNIVYFNGTIAEIISNTNSSITVRRPNLVVPSTSIEVVSNGAFDVAKYGNPYKVPIVSQKYGTFLDNVSLSTIVVDSAENIYVVETSTFNIFKATPGGNKTVLSGKVPWVPSDMRIGPNGNLYFFATTAGNPREIAMADVRTGTVTTRWRYLPQSRLAKFGDFGDNGFLYLGGGSDLYILNLSTQPTGSGSTATYAVTQSGLYTGSTILGLRVYEGYLYVAAIKGAAQGIWKHLIKPDGTLDANATLVLDWNATSYGSRTIRNFALASDLTSMYVQTNNPDDNLLVVTPQGIDVFYKGILRPYGIFLDWSKNANFLYMICGNTTPAEEWNVYRVDMGAKSASRIHR